MRTIAILLGLGATMLAACVGVSPTIPPPERTVAILLPSDVAPVNRSTDEFYVVWLSGSEQAHRLGGAGPEKVAICDRAWTHTLDAARQVFEYDPNAISLDPSHLSVLVVLEYHGVRLDKGGLSQGCEPAPRVEGFPGRAALTYRIRADLSVDLVVEPQNGLVAYNQTLFALMGKKVHVNHTRIQSNDADTYWIAGDFEITNLGVWKGTALRPRDPAGSP